MPSFYSALDDLQPALDAALEQACVGALKRRKGAVQARKGARVAAQIAFLTQTRDDEETA